MGPTPIGPLGALDIQQNAGLMPEPIQVAVIQGENEYVRKGNIKIDCKEVWKQISNFLDDELPSDLRATMVAHLRECAHCTAVLDGTRNVVQLLGDGRVFEVPAGAGQRLYRKLKKSLAMCQAVKH